jgi:hypothetical protein
MARQMSSTYSTELTIGTPPPCAIPYDNTPVTEGEFSTDIGSAKLIRTSQALFRAECAKHMIVLDSVSKARSGCPMTEQETEACYAQLTCWWASRSLTINADRHPTKENLLCA